MNDRQTTDAHTEHQPAPDAFDETPEWRYWAKLPTALPDDPAYRRACGRAAPWLPRVTLSLFLVADQKARRSEGLVRWSEIAAEARREIPPDDCEATVRATVQILLDEGILEDAVVDGTRGFILRADLRGFVYRSTTAEVKRAQARDRKARQRRRERDVTRDSSGSASSSSDQVSGSARRVPTPFDSDAPEPFAEPSDLHPIAQAIHEIRGAEQARQAAERDPGAPPPMIQPRRLTWAFVEDENAAAQRLADIGWKPCHVGKVLEVAREGWPEAVAGLWTLDAIASRWLDGRQPLRAAYEQGKQVRARAAAPSTNHRAAAQSQAAALEAREWAQVLAMPDRLRPAAMEAHRRMFPEFSR